MTTETTPTAPAMTARRALDAAEEACTCDRRCRCAAAPAIAAAKLAEREAIAANIEREAAWKEYHAIRAL